MGERVLDEPVTNFELFDILSEGLSAGLESEASRLGKVRLSDGSRIEFSKKEREDGAVFVINMVSSRVLEDGSFSFDKEGLVSFLSFPTYLSRESFKEAKHYGRSVGAEYEEFLRLSAPIISWVIDSFIQDKMEPLSAEIKDTATRISGKLHAF